LTGYDIQDIQDTVYIRSLDHSTTVIFDNSYGERICHVMQQFAIAK